LAQDLAIKATSDLFARVEETPAVQSLARRLEEGGLLSSDGISQAAQPFFAALLRQLFPKRPIVVVVEDLKLQESFQQDLTTWMGIQSSRLEGFKPGVRNAESQGQDQISGAESDRTHHSAQPFFYPAWEILPHEDRLPHVDVISERLETLTALAQRVITAANRGGGPEISPLAPVIVTSVAALLQRTFSRDALLNGTRTLARGDRVTPFQSWLDTHPGGQILLK